MIQYGKMRKVFVFLVLILIAFFAFFIWWQQGKQAVNPHDRSEKIFVINKGEGIREIGKSLKKDGLIRDQIVFFLLVKKLDKDKDIQAGDYRLSPSMDLSTIVDKLSHGTLDIWVTIPEGLRAEEIADILKEDNFKNYNDSWKQTLVENNGYLFPDTYLIPKDADIDQIVEIMRNNFYKQIEGIGLDKNSSNLGEIVTVASLVEREVKFADEKPLVASVIYNRLKINMPLQIDATVQYALGKQADGKWWKQVMPSDLKIDSPFNTYKVIGLPPTPISNPGILSIKAAVSPASTDYLYYVADKQGRSRFSKTLIEHDKNINSVLK